MRRTHRSRCAHALGSGWCALALCALVGCPGDEEPAKSGLDALREAIALTVVPGVSTFAERAASLEGAVPTFCVGPDAAKLAELQAQTRDLMHAWSAIAAYNFGPLDDDLITPRIIFIESMRQRGVDYTTTVREAIATALASDDILDDGYVDALTFNKVGLLALEVLLFEDSREDAVGAHATDAASIVDDFVAAPRKCAYLEGIARHVAETARAVDHGWRVDDGSGSPFADAMERDELDDGTQPIVALLVAMHEHLDYVKVRKLEGVLDARLSGEFYPNVRATLDAYGEVLAPSGAEFSLFDYMDQRTFTDERVLVEKNLEAAVAAAELGDRAALTATIGVLEGNFKREIPDALGVDLGINFSDGD
jgi:predicted lipoprotein